MKEFINSIFGAISVSETHGKLIGEIRLSLLASEEKIIPLVWEKAGHDNKTLIVGYKLPNGDGEFIQIDLCQNEVRLQTDYFGSHPLFYAEIGQEFIFGTEINDLLRYGKVPLSIDLDELYRYFAFGYPTFSQNTFYSSIHQLESNSVLRVRANSSNSMEISARKLDRILDHSAYTNASANEILQDGILKRINHLHLDKVVLPISGGYDSGILLNCFRQLSIPVVCASFGLPDSHDVLIGRKRARTCHYEYYHSDQFYKLGKTGLHNLLNEYSLATGGIGPATEIEFLSFIKDMSESRTAFVLGGAGEFYRNYLKSKEYFSENYLTPEDTIAKYTFAKYDKEQYLDLIYQKYGPEDTLGKFYVEERYPKNICRKGQTAKKYGVVLNPLANRFLYNYIFSNTDPKARASGEVMLWLLPEKTGISLENKANKSYMDIAQFFSRIEEILSDYLLNGYDLTAIGVNTPAILKSIKDSAVTERDKWFLSRILNLSIYLTNLNKGKN